MSNELSPKIPTHHPAIMSDNGILLIVKINVFFLYRQILCLLLWACILLQFLLHQMVFCSLWVHDTLSDTSIALYWCVVLLVNVSWAHAKFDWRDFTLSHLMSVLDGYCSSNMPCFVSKCLYKFDTLATLHDKQTGRPPLTDGTNEKSFDHEFWNALFSKSTLCLLLIPDITGGGGAAAAW